VPATSFIYHDYFPAGYQTYIATAPARNKTCTWTAKSTPYLSCHREKFPAKEPGPVAGWLRQVTQPPFIAGPLVKMLSATLIGLAPYLDKFLLTSISCGTLIEKALRSTGFLTVPVDNIII
jgi:hypothetical protein